MHQPVCTTARVTSSGFDVYYNTCPVFCSGRSSTSAKIKDNQRGSDRTNRPGHKLIKQTIPSICLLTKLRDVRCNKSWRLSALQSFARCHNASVLPAFVPRNDSVCSASLNPFPLFLSLSPRPNFELSLPLVRSSFLFPPLSIMSAVRLS